VPTRHAETGPHPQPDKHGSDTTTRGIRVIVSPQHVPEEDMDPNAPHIAEGDQWKGRRFIFAYQVRVTNESQATVQLLRRHWHIVDADGDVHEVRGDGVVGQQPTLKPGTGFEYSSYCPLQTPWGTMEGEYTFRDLESDEEFDARIGRFYLVGQ
jgi:ApaG protein